MGERNNTNGTGRTDLKAWGLGILTTVIVLLLGWIGVSNLQSLAFQAAVQPQIETLVTDAKTTKNTVNDIKVEMGGFATKDS